MKSIENKTTFLYSLAATVLVSILVVFYFTNKKFRTTTSLVERSREVLSKSDRILLDILNAETGFRGYLLTGNILFLEPYDNAVRNLDTDMAELEVLINDNPGQLQLKDLLKKAIEARMLFTIKYIGLKKENKWNELENDEIIRKGKILTDEIRNCITDISSDEIVLLNLRKNGSEQSNKNSELIFMLLFGSIITIFLLVLIVIRGHKTRNIELQEYTTSQKLLSNYSLSLIEASLDPLITISADGKITDMNEALANITGMTRAELTGTDFLNYFTEPQKAREVYQEVFAKGSVADFPLTLRHKNGRLTDVLFNGSVYNDDRGDVLGEVIVARAVAEQKWATE